MSNLIISVMEIIGNCPVYKVGDKIVINDGYVVNLLETDDMYAFGFFYYALLCSFK